MKTAARILAALAFAGFVTSGALAQTTTTAPATTTTTTTPAPAKPKTAMSPAKTSISKQCSALADQKGLHGKDRENSARPARRTAARRRRKADKLVPARLSTLSQDDCPSEKPR